MAKLQLYITMSTADFKSVYNINPSEDVRAAITDLRKAVESIDYDPAEKNIFYFLKSTDEGSFVTVLRTIPSRPGDHLAAWIYLPANMKISADQLESVVHLTTRKVSGREVTQDDVTALREAFSADYPVQHDCPAITGNYGTGYAWRLYGGDEAPSLHEFMGRGRWQQYYLPFEGVLLIDEELGITAAGDDLTDRPLGADAVILPPEPSDDGFRPYVFNRLLDRPLRATMGCELDIDWRRPGFEDVTRTVRIDSAEYTPRPAATDDSRKIIRPNSFKITSRFSHTPVSGCQIRVNGHEITDKGRSFTRGELGSASVVVSCEGFIPFSGHIDLASTTQALIQLQERRKVYVFELPVKNSELGAPIKFEIQSKEPLTESPLEGYKLLDDIQEGATRTNHLGYTGGSVLGSLGKQALFVAAGIIVGLLLGFGCGRCSRGETELAPTNAEKVDSTASTRSNAIAELSATEDTSLPVAKAPQTKPAADASAANVNPALTSADAIKYLDENKTWTKEDLEKYADLQGLYDDMNNFRVQKLVDTWGPKLKDSKTFSDLAQHAKEGIRKGKAKLDGKTYNSPDDNKIMVRGYLYKVDP